MKEKPKEGISAIKEIRVMMSLPDDIIFIGGSIKKDTKEVFFKVGNESINIEEYGEIDILSNKELIEVKTGNYVIKPKGLSEKDLKQILKLKRLRNGDPQIYDQNKKIYNLSNKLLVLQVDQNEISPIVLAQLRKQGALDVIRLGNGSEIKISEIPFDGKYRKPSIFSGMPTIKSLQDYLNIKL
ncbi:hypothetical protein QE422_001816 [Chryseobacterium sp. SORGH_AS 447]|uniref:hypothetical protein n=1 Tax=Chryseobacterium sp. SORGH_AS_0447 TaxID=3041769 RepID=UPI0027819C6A|nr:hypothetical protein [Chryseobacterium sp. SORGH_AS_0447]MDQ1161448.1 hypothetical protein [Chryseobacterium sp. SORGH_AS_0447]